MTPTNFQSGFHATRIFQIDMDIFNYHDLMKSSIAERPDPTTPLDPMQSFDCNILLSRTSECHNYSRNCQANTLIVDKLVGHNDCKEERCQET